jgi:hypothetical protein
MQSNKDEAPLGPLSARQKELIRILQGLPPDSRHTITVVCRGTEPWEIQQHVEHRRIGELKPKD